MEKLIKTNTQKLAPDHWLCPLSGKTLKGPELIRKHLLYKHMDTKRGRSEDSGSESGLSPDRKSHDHKRYELIEDKPTTSKNKNKSTKDTESVNQNCTQPFSTNDGDRSLFYEIINAKNSEIETLKKSWNQMMESNKRERELLNEKIVQINTNLLYKCGILHSRGIFEHFETQYSGQKSNQTRSSKWYDILNNYSHIKERIREIYDSNNNEEIVNQILAIYSNLSHLIHGQIVSASEVIISNTLNKKAAKFLGYLCQELKINYSYEKDDEKYLN